MNPFDVSPGTAPDGSISNSELGSMAESTIKGRAAGAGTGAPQDLTATQTRTAIGLGTMATQNASAVAITGGAVSAPLVAFGADTSKNIASDAITATGSFHSVDTEGAAATDNLATINGGTPGQILVLAAYDTTHTVVVKDGTGNLRLAGDFSMDSNQDRIVLLANFDGSIWYELCRSDSGA